MVKNIEECILLLRELVDFLHKKKSTVDDKKSPTQTLLELRVALSPWSREYFGNLLLPAFKNKISEFIQTQSTVKNEDEYIQALEFAYSREIKGLQLCYDEEWGKKITKEEHSLLLKHNPPLGNKEDIGRFINTLLKAKGVSSKKNKNEDMSFEINQMEMLNEKKLLECDIREEDLMLVLKKMSTTMFAPKNDAGSKNKKKKASNSEVKPKKDKVDKNKKEDVIVDEFEPLPMNTRQGDNNKLMKATDIPTLSRITTEKERYAISQLIISKEKLMLEKMKTINDKCKRFMKPIRFWNRGFSKLYLHWIDITLSNKEDVDKMKKDTFDDFYNETDDLAFILLLGQRQADILHKFEFELNNPYIMRRKDEKDNEDEDEFADTQKEEKSTTNSEPILWKTYLSLCRRGKGCDKWKDNYKFLSVKVFIALYRNKLIQIGSVFDASCYAILESTYDTYLLNKAKSIPITDTYTIKSKSRDERYASIFTIIFECTKSRRTELLLQIQWEPYWNLLSVLPQENPLCKMLSRRVVTAPKYTRASLILQEEPIIDNEGLNSKTRARLLQWWSQQPFYKINIDELSKI